jgi:hypothetical protein
MAPSLRELFPRSLPVGNGDGKLGTGVVPGTSLNNAGFLALFAILGAAMVIAAIYFFFVAKNGGFKKITVDDWDDYKSTVLRRKGPDGKTLSNATKSTKLGGGSVVPKWAKTEYTRSTESSYGDQEMREVEEGRRHQKTRDNRQTSRHDPELAAYKHEKAAKVGGINTSLHGSQWDASNTDRSDVTPQPAPTQDSKEAKKAEKERKAREKAEQKEAARKEKEQKKMQKKSKYADSEADREVAQQPRRSKPSAAYSFQQGDDTESSVYTATNTQADTRYTQPQSSIRQVSYYENYRPHSNHLPPVREQPTPPSSYHSDRPRDRDSGTRSNRASRESMNHQPTSRQGSPRKQHRPPTAVAPRSDYTSTTDTGTKVYEHHIPGVSKGEVGVDDSVSQVGARRYQQQYRASQGPPPASNSSGYRRGGGRGRGDSLSESEM